MTTSLLGAFYAKQESRTDDNRGSKMLGAVILYSALLDSVLLCTVHVYARVHTSIYIYIYVYTYIYVHTYKYIYIYIYFRTPETRSP